MDKKMQKELIDSFLKLSAEEKVKRVEEVKQQMLDEMLKRLTTYMELDKKMRQRYNMDFEHFTKSNRHELSISFNEYHQSHSLWQTAYDGIGMLGDTFLKLSGKDSFTGIGG